MVGEDNIQQQKIRRTKHTNVENLTLLVENSQRY